MAVKERDFDGDLWFFTEDPSHKTDEVRTNPEVNVALEAGIRLGVDRRRRPRS